MLKNQFFRRSEGSCVKLPGDSGKYAGFYSVSHFETFMKKRFLREDKETANYDGRFAAAYYRIVGKFRYSLLRNPVKDFFESWGVF